jgi:hypothetical protein
MFNRMIGHCGGGPGWPFPDHWKSVALAESAPVATLADTMLAINLRMMPPSS